MEATEQRARTFVERVESRLDCEVDYAPELGDELGWFSLELRYQAEGEEFLGETDFELSTAGVEVLYAEITVPMEETERRTILASIGERIIGVGGEESFRYEPTEAELSPLLSDLSDIHGDVFG